LEVVKQEMARVNVDILGISELKWTDLTQMILIRGGKNTQFIVIHIVKGFGIVIKQK